MKLGGVCWVVEYTGAPKQEVVKTKVRRVIDAHPGRSDPVVATEAGRMVSAVAVFDHEPHLATMADEYGSFTKWV